MAAKSKFKPGEIVVACESFVSSALPSGPFQVSAGQRLRANHPIVERTLQFWAPDGTASDELDRQRQQIYRDAEAAAPVFEIPAAQPERRIRDQDAVVAIVDVGLQVPQGTRIHKRSPIAKHNKAAFVPVVPKGLARDDAVVPIQRITHTREDGTTEVLHAGQWVDRKHPFVAINANMVRRPEYQPEHEEE